MIEVVAALIWDKDKFMIFNNSHLKIGKVLATKKDLSKMEELNNKNRLHL